jgi:hypothetical protein
MSMHVRTFINNTQYYVLLARTQGKPSRLSVNNLPLNSYSIQGGTEEYIFKHHNQ